MKKTLAVVSVMALLAVLLLMGCTQPVQNPTIDQNWSDNMAKTNDLNSSKVVKVGDTVSVNYTGKLTDGNVFDSSVGKSPLTFEAGAGQMIKGFDAAVIGMKVGQTKTITIPAAGAYGEINENNKQLVPKNQLPADLNVGQVLVIGQYRLKVYEIVDGNVLVSVNHFLAGQTLIFDITIVSIQ